jgi:hypothetical protein
LIIKARAENRPGFFYAWQLTLRQAPFDLAQDRQGGRRTKNEVDNLFTIHCSLFTDHRSPITDHRSPITYFLPFWT